MPVPSSAAPNESHKTCRRYGRMHVVCATSLSLFLGANAVRVTSMEWSKWKVYSRFLSVYDIEVHIKIVAIISELFGVRLRLYRCFCKPLVGSVMLMSVSHVGQICMHKQSASLHIGEHIQCFGFLLAGWLDAAASNEFHSTFSPKVHFELYNAITWCHYTHNESPVYVCIARWDVDGASRCGS